MLWWTGCASRPGATIDRARECASIAKGRHAPDMTVLLPVVLFVAFVFPMLGMGGGQLYTPAFYWLGLDLRTEAVPLALWLSFSSQSAAALNYWRHGLVQFRAGLPITAGLVVFAPVGAVVSHHTPEKVILFLFASMTVAALLQISIKRRPGEGSRSHPGLMVASLLGGTAIGFLAGMVGRGGGSLVVPQLLLLGLDPKRAAATSSLAVCSSSLSGFVSHLAITGPALPVHCFAVLTAAAAAAAFAGSRYMARRLRSGAVGRLFTVALVGVAAKLYWDVFAGRAASGRTSHLIGS